MSFPLMNKRPRQAVVVPDLSGGMNLRDSVSMVLDNQLTDARNVWFKDGILKTRPGIDNMEHFKKESWRNAEIKPHEVFYTVDGEVCRLFTAETDTHIYFFWIGKNSFIELSSIETTCKNLFVVQKDKLLYCFLQSGTVYRCDVSADKLTWEPVNEEEFYAPIISINHVPTFDSKDISEPVMVEGYNLLSSYYRAKYSTVDKSAGDYDENGDPITVSMTYALVNPLYELDANDNVIWSAAGKDVIVTIEYPRFRNGGDGLPLGKITHRVHLEEGFEREDAFEDSFKRDGLKLWVRQNEIFFLDEETEDVARAEVISGTLNDMTVTAPYNKENQKHKIFNMSRAEWFGGAAEGISGGTRLFLGGNETEPNLVVWSDLNNPLYFPENNYFYVGESTSPVTAFGKQSDMLVIFKDNETYYTQYQRNTGISAEAVMNQSVIDIAASSVYFPLTLINANIGCDCPDTVELCRNRLVWTNSDGKVYTLVSNNQYNERNIFEIGEMIHRKLKTEKNLKNARSIDWNGYYLLHTKDAEGNRIYVLDYNSYGYQYVSSYSKTEDANLRIPWYYWDFELKAGNLQSTALDIVDGSLLLVESGYYGIFKAEFNEEAAYDYLIVSTDTSLEGYRPITVPIKSEAHTKLFEFGAQGYYKNVDKVVLSVGNNGGVPINVSFVTDMGTEETEIVPDGSQTEAYTPGYVKSMQLSPCIRQVERFGVKLSCDGPLAVDGITLKYGIMRGAR